MGKIVVSENITLDGVVGDPTGEEGYPARRLVRPDRARPTGRRGPRSSSAEALGAEALLMGRRSVRVVRVALGLARPASGRTG